MKTLALLLILTACASEPAMNSANVEAAGKRDEKKISILTPDSSQYEFEGYKVNAKECSFVRTMYLEISPVQTKEFQALLKKRINPQAIMGMDLKKQKNKSNPCSRLRLYKSINQISYQGSKAKWGDKGYLVKARLGESSDGLAFMNIEFFQRKTKNSNVRTMNPGHLLSYERIKEMTDEELVDWIITTVYTIGWK